MNNLIEKLNELIYLNTVLISKLNKSIHENAEKNNKNSNSRINYLKLMARKSQKNAFINWDNEKQKKFYISYCRLTNEVLIDYSLTIDHDPELGYWIDENEIKKFINKYEKYLLWYFRKCKRA